MAKPPLKKFVEDMTHTISGFTKDERGNRHYTTAIIAARINDPEGESVVNPSEEVDENKPLMPQFLRKYFVLLWVPKPNNAYKITDLFMAAFLDPGIYARELAKSGIQSIIVEENALKEKWRSNIPVCEDGCIARMFEMFIKLKDIEDVSKVEVALTDVDFSVNLS
jgi:hypothetical protein